MKLPRWNNARLQRPQGKRVVLRALHSGQGLEVKKRFSLPVEGEVFSLTFPFIDQAISRFDPDCCKNQPFLPESIRVHSETIAAAAAATHATADHEMSQREPVGEVIFARERATRKKARLDSAIVAHSRHPVSTRGRRTSNLYS